MPSGSWILDAEVSCVIRYLYREPYGRRPMLHKIEALSSGESMILDYSDWYHLLHLAARYGWRAQEDLSHYMTEEHAISAYEAQEIADASSVPTVIWIPKVLLRSRPRGSG